MGGVVDFFQDVFEGIGDLIQGAISWLIPMPELPDLGNLGTDTQGQQAQALKVNKKASNVHIPVIYGIRRVGGTLVYLESSGVDDDNEFLYGCLVLGEGQVAGLLQVIIDDQIVDFSGTFGFSNLQEAVSFDGDAGSHITSPFTHGRIYTSNDDRFFDTVQIQFFDGRDNQSASTLLSENSNWSTNHRLRGISYLAFKLRYNTDVFGGLPSIQCELKGRRIYDPRLDSTKGGSGSHRADDSSTWAWSANPSLCLLDYLRNSRFGKTLPDTFFETNYDSFKDSSDDCDTKVDPYSTPSVALKKFVLQDNSKTGLVGYRYLNGYHNDNPKFFAGAEPTGTNRGITTVGTGVVSGKFNPNDDRQNTSYIYKGYFIPDESTSYQFKTTSDDSSLVFLGSAGKDIETFVREYTDSTNYDIEGLVVDNSGLHPNQAKEGGAFSVNAGSVYPIFMVHGNAGGGSDFTFEWKKSGGSYSTDLSTLFFTEDRTTPVESTLTTLTDTPIFSCHAVINTSNKILKNTKDILNSCRGYLPYSQGKYKLKIEKAGTASITLTEDDIIGGISIKSEEVSNKYNRVFVNYINPQKQYESDQVQFPPVDETGLDTADQYATLLSVDNDKPLDGNFDFDFITNPYQAEEMAEVILRRSRNMLSCNLQCTAEASDLEIGDIVNITHSGVGFSAKPFRVQKATLNSDFTISLTLSEHQSAFYDWATKQDVGIVQDTNLPNPYIINKPTIDNVSDKLIELQDGNVQSIMTIEVSSGDKFVRSFQCDIAQITDNQGNFTGFGYETLGTSTTGTFEKLPVLEGATYQINVRAISSSGVKSDIATSTHTVNSAFEPPADVSNYNIDVVGDKLHHTWTGNSDIDLNYYEIRFSSNTSETIYANAIDLVKKIARPANSIVTPFVGSGVYFIKAVDKFEVRSQNATRVIIEEKQFTGTEELTGSPITENPNFTGTKNNVVAIDSILKLDTSITFDSATGDIDDAIGLWDGGNGNVASEGTYDFATDFDFGAKFKFSFFYNNFTTSHLDYVNRFGDAQGFWDSREGVFDGDTDEDISTNVELLISTSADGVSYNTYKPFIVGDYIAQAFKLRAKLTSTSALATPQIENLSIGFVLPKTSQSGSNITSGTDTAGKTVNFTDAFYQTPTITIIGQNMETGDYFKLNSKDREKFIVEFFDSGNNTINRTFDYQAIGIGQQQ